MRLINMINMVSVLNPIFQPTEALTLSLVIMLEMMMKMVMLLSRNIETKVKSYISLINMTLGCTPNRL